MFEIVAISTTFFFYNSYFLLMWTVFKVLTEFVAVLLLLLSYVWAFFGLKARGILAS